MKKRHDRVLTVDISRTLGTNETRFQVTPEQLAELLGDLRYDSLAVYLDALAKKVQRDSVCDGGRGRGMLATHLGRAAFDLDEVTYHVRKAWDVCEPYTKEGEDQQ